MTASVLLIDLWPDLLAPGMLRERFAQLPVAAAAAGLELAVAHHLALGERPREAPLGIILSGSRTNLVDDPDEDQLDGAPLARFAPVLELLSSLPAVPVLGICFGHQLLAKAGGGVLERMPAERFDGHHPIELLERDPLFAAVPPAPAFAESHRWRVAVPGAGYRVVARSADGIEMVRHGQLPRVGVQFHPEYWLRQPPMERWGQRVLANWLSRLPDGGRA
jgi:GMP synthase (glutamine-hydrolysing)